MADKISSAYIASRKILNVISKNYISQKFSILLSAAERDELSKACIDMKSVVTWDFSYQEFYRNICSFLYLPLEFLWKLHVFQIMPFGAFLLNIEAEKPVFLKFKEKICNIYIIEDAHNDSSFFVQSGILSYIVKKAFPVMSEMSGEEKLQEICTALIKDLLQGIYSNGHISEEQAMKRLGPLLAVWNSGILDRSSLHAFCSFALNQYIHMLFSESVLNVYQIQEKWESKTDPFHLMFLIEKMVKVLHTKEMECLLYNAVKTIVTNMKNYLAVITAFLSSHEEGAAILHGMIADFMKDACECSDENLLQKVILIGRQIELKSNVPFHTSHKLWFQSFCNECVKLKDPKSFALIICALSDLVPLEKNIENLKVHIECSLPIPPECQSVYSDYIALLKTRIKDLKPEVCHGQIVHKILISFQETGKIPPVILEASLFQKHQYLNEFLPALLVPRILPPVPDLREKFIDALYQAGKIPTNILERYKVSCLQEEKNLLTDIDMAENLNDFLEDFT